jgi:YHS domain-containing protein
MSQSHKNLIALLVLLVLSVGNSPVFSGTKRVEVAHSGYDVVAYFTVGKAEKGNSKYSATYKDAIYHFSSSDHQAIFLQNPVKYLPQYDGYCAYGITFSQKIKADPTVWKIVNDKLYFNMNQKFLNDWSKDVMASIKSGNEEWELIKNVPPEEL